MNNSNIKRKVKIADKNQSCRQIITLYLLTNDTCWNWTCWKLILVDNDIWRQMILVDKLNLLTNDTSRKLNLLLTYTCWQLIFAHKLYLLRSKKIDQKQRFIICIGYCGHVNDKHSEVNNLQELWHIFWKYLESGGCAFLHGVSSISVKGTKYPSNNVIYQSVGTFQLAAGSAKTSTVSYCTVDGFRFIATQLSAHPNLQLTKFWYEEISWWICTHSHNKEQCGDVVLQKCAKWQSNPVWEYASWIQKLQEYDEKKRRKVWKHPP